MIIQPISLEQVIDIRNPVLRHNRGREFCVYPGDQAPGVVHFGAFKDDRLVGVASVYPESRDQQPSLTDWRLRGMAVLDEYQGQGIGRQLVNAFIDHIRERKGKVVWCNARKTAYRFYEGLGFAIEGEEFDIPGIGPHSVMVKSL